MRQRNEEPSVVHSSSQAVKPEEQIQPDAFQGRGQRLAIANLYVIDESCMASTKQLHRFVERWRESDHVLFVGDVRQHEAVEGGRPMLICKKWGCAQPR